MPIYIYSRIAGEGQKLRSRALGWRGRAKKRVRSVEGTRSRGYPESALTGGRKSKCRWRIVPQGHEGPSAWAADRRNTINGKLHTNAAAMIKFAPTSVLRVSGTMQSSMHEDPGALADRGVSAPATRTKNTRHPKVSPRGPRLRARPRGPEAGPGIRNLGTPRSTAPDHRVQG
jgi:hypothetical protein